jgi:hypothetical protein
MFRTLEKLRSALGRASAGVVLFVVLASCAAGSAEQEGGTVNESKAPSVGAPIAVQERRMELSGCAAVEGGVLVVEDELIGAVLLLDDFSQGPLSLSTIKLERKKKERAPYADAFKLFPFQDFEDIASDGGSTVFLLGSHHGKGGERRPDREFLFCADWDPKDRELKVVGEQYGLLKTIAPLLDTLGCGIGLSTTEVSDTLNMEGLALHGDTLYLGLRSPLTTAGKAIVLFGSAQAIMAGAATLQPLELDLNGSGVRALDWDPVSGTLLVLGGPSSDTPGSAGLYSWNPVTSALANLIAFEPDVARKGPEGVCRLPVSAGGKLLVVLDGEGSEHGAEFIEIDG